MAEEDKGFIIMGPELENGGRSALRVTTEGTQEGVLFREGLAPNDCAGGMLSRIRTEQISGSIYQVTDEEVIGKPSMVNSKQYRENFDNIFGNKQAVGEA
jgi:hypothetical protein